MFQYTMWMFMHRIHLVLLSAILSKEIFSVHLFLTEIHVFVFCAIHNSIMNFIPQPQVQKSCRRQTQCSSILCTCLCIQPIWCCPLQPIQIRCFFVSACHKSKMNFITQPQEQKSCRRQTQCSNTLCDASATKLFGVVLCNPFK